MYLDTRRIFSFLINAGKSIQYILINKYPIYSKLDSKCPRAYYYKETMTTKNACDKLLTNLKEWCNIFLVYANIAQLVEQQIRNL